MTRRRPTFPQYLRRRWRAVGLILVLLAGGLLVLAVTDRGHDPVWDVRAGVVEELAVSPDGSAVYALPREAGVITRLEARSGETGALLWESAMDSTGALLRAGEAEVAVATDFPRAFLTLYGANGDILWHIPLEGSPRALAVEDGVVALALRAPGNPVLLVEGGQVLRVHRFSSLVDALDLHAGRLAVGTEGGELVVFSPAGARLTNVTLPVSVRTLLLDGDAATVAYGGSGVGANALAGGVGVVSVGAAAPVRWHRDTALPVGLVSLDRAGRSVLAVEAVPPHALYAFDARTGETRWARPAEGVVSRDDAGAFGGAALSPDGTTVVVVTLSGPVRAFDAASGDLRWSYEAGGTVAAFAREAPARFVTNARHVQNGPLDGILLFSAESEPAAGRFGVAAAGLTLVAAGAASVVLGVGFWRARRSW